MGEAGVQLEGEAMETVREAPKPGVNDAFSDTREGAV